MPKFSEKVIEHLQFAKNWLDRAEEEYSNEKILEAELTLSLAEAEVRHAWETSRGSQNSAALRIARLWRRRISIAALVTILVWGGYYHFEHQESGYPGDQYSLGQPIMPGQWERNIEYKLIIQVPQQPKEPAPIDNQAEEVPTPVREVREPEVPAKPVSPEKTEPIPAEPGETFKVEGEPTPGAAEVQAKTEEPTEPGEVEEPVAEETDSVPKNEEPAETRAPAEPPKLDLGELFQVANNALNGK